MVDHSGSLTRAPPVRGRPMGAHGARATERLGKIGCFRSEHLGVDLLIDRLRIQPFNRQNARQRGAARWRYTVQSRFRLSRAGILRNHGYGETLCLQFRPAMTPCQGSGGTEPGRQFVTDHRVQTDIVFPPPWRTGFFCWDSAVPPAWQEIKPVRYFRKRRTGCVRRTV